jgi:hypothetical protein
MLIVGRKRISPSSAALYSAGVTTWVLNGSRVKAVRDDGIVPE